MTSNEKIGLVVYAVSMFVWVAILAGVQTHYQKVLAAHEKRLRVIEVRAGRRL